MHTGLDSNDHSKEDIEDIEQDMETLVIQKVLKISDNLTEIRQNQKFKRINNKTQNHLAFSNNDLVLMLTDHVS